MMWLSLFPLLVLYTVLIGTERKYELVGVAAIKKSIGGDDNVQFIHLLFKYTIYC